VIRELGDPAAVRYSDERSSMSTSYKRKHGRLVATHGEGIDQVFAAYAFATRRYALALPDRTLEGFYLQHIKELTEVDVRNLAEALYELLAVIDGGVDQAQLDSAAAVKAVAEYERRVAKACGRGATVDDDGAPKWHRVNGGGHYQAQYGDDMLEIVDSEDIGSSRRWLVIANGKDVGYAPRAKAAKAAALAAVSGSGTMEGGE
jgi:hypothetical protein